VKSSRRGGIKYLRRKRNRRLGGYLVKFWDNQDGSKRGRDEGRQGLKESKVGWLCSKLKKRRTEEDQLRVKRCKIGEVKLIDEKRRRKGKEARTHNKERDANESTCRS